jgi:hypothetical protein
MDATSTSAITITVAKASTSLTWATTPMTSVASDAPMPLANAVLTGMPTTPIYSIDVGSSAVCTINATTGVITPLRAGVCTYTADVDHSLAFYGNYAVTPISVNLSISPGAPGAPGKPDVALADTTMNVQWAAPTTDGGSAIATVCGDSCWWRLNFDLRCGCSCI